MKNNFSPTLEDIPRLCDHRRGFELLIELRQSDHHVGNDIEGDMIRRQRPVEAGRLGAKVDAKKLIGAGFFRAFFASGKADQENENSQAPIVRSFVV